MNHTQFYNDFWANINNYNFQFYDNRTFGMDRENPCDVINDNLKYRKLMNKEFNCTGPWCINNTFNCNSGDSRKCYNVEHIIDLNGGEFKNASCKAIAANLVMSSGIWNQQLGSLSISLIGGYEANINEKKIVYSNNRVEMARNAIIKCNPECILLNVNNYKETYEYNETNKYNETNTFNLETNKYNETNKCNETNECNETKKKFTRFIGFLLSVIISILGGLIIGLISYYVYYKIQKLGIHRSTSTITPINDSIEINYINV